MLPQSKLFQVIPGIGGKSPDTSVMVIYYGVTFDLSATKLHNLQKLQDRATTLIQSAPITKDRIPSATLSVNQGAKHGRGIAH